MLKQDILNGLERAMDEISRENMLSGHNMVNIILALMYLVEREK